MPKTYGLGSFEKVPGKLGMYWFTMPLGHGKRSKKILCRGNNLKNGQKLYALYLANRQALEEECALEVAKGDKELRTVRSYLETQWEAVKGKLAGTSRHLYESSLTVHVYADSIFCDLDIHNISSDDVKEFLLRREQAGATENTQYRLYKHLRWYFQKAVDCKPRKLPENPIFLIKSERPRVNKSRIVEFAENHEEILIQYAMEDEIFRPITIFLLDTGCRSGEMLGLQWDALSFTRGECTIKRSLDMVDYQPLLKDDVKSASSLRTIPLSKFTLDMLKALKSTTKGTSSDFVFGGGDGPNGCWNRYKFTRRWNALLLAAKLPHYGIHTTRHSVACRLLRSGMYLPSVAARLGHANPETTLRLYSHAMPNDGVKLASSFDNFANKALKNTTEKTTMVA